MSETVYKLTTTDDRTRGGTQWGPGVTHTAPGGGVLCTKAYIHAYSDPLLAVFMDPIHGGFGESAHLWRCDAEGEHKTDRRLKEGYTRVTTIERVELPVLTTEQRVRFAILCAMEVAKEPFWRTWAQGWLDGHDRSAAAAWAAGMAVGEARPSASKAAAVWAARTAWAGWAPAACAARAVQAGWASETAEWAAWAVEAAARMRPLDLPALARKALEEGR